MNPVDSKVTADDIFPQTLDHSVLGSSLMTCPYPAFPLDDRKKKMIFYG
jgi:hypothetical protein